jgi:transposase-like protein
MSERKGLEGLFDGRHFDREIIILRIRWYLRYKLSLLDLVEMMAERGVSLAHTTILRGVQRYTSEFVKRWNLFATPTSRSWRVDETYLKVPGRWVYLYRAVDRAGRTVDFMIRTRRGVAAAKSFILTASCARHMRRPFMQYALWYLRSRRHCAPGGSPGSVPVCKARDAFLVASQRKNGP